MMPILNDAPEHFRPSRELGQPKGSIVRDLADKSGETWAVIWNGDLLPIRFNREDASAHLFALRDKNAGHGAAA